MRWSAISKAPSVESMSAGAPWAVEFRLDTGLKARLDELTAEYRRGDAVR